MSKKPEQARFVPVHRRQDPAAAAAASTKATGVTGPRGTTTRLSAQAENDLASAGLLPSTASKGPAAAAPVSAEKHQQQAQTPPQPPQQQEEAEEAVAESWESQADERGAADEWETLLDRPEQLDAVAENLRQLSVQQASKSPAASTPPPPASNWKGRGSSRYNSPEAELGPRPPTFFDQADDDAVSGGGGHDDRTDSRRSSDANTDHVLEVYDVIPPMSTADVGEMLAPYRTLGYRLKPIDAHRCLAIFRSPVIARDALRKLTHPMIKLRPLNESTDAVRQLASANVESYMVSESTEPRPKTNVNAAQRLVAHSLQNPELLGRAREQSAADRRREQDRRSTPRSKETSKDYWE